MQFLLPNRQLIKRFARSFEHKAAQFLAAHLHRRRMVALVRLATIRIRRIHALFHAQHNDILTIEHNAEIRFWLDGVVDLIFHGEREIVWILHAHALSCIIYAETDLPRTVIGIGADRLQKRVGHICLIFQSLAFSRHQKHLQSLHYNIKPFRAFFVRTIARKIFFRAIRKNIMEYDLQNSQEKALGENHRGLFPLCFQHFFNQKRLHGCS